MIQKSYKYRIYPDKNQQELIEKHFGCARWAFNWGLEKKIKAYQKNKKQISYFDLTRELTKLKKKKDFQWLNEVNSQSLQQALRNLDNAFTGFFRRYNKFPKFKSKKENRQSFQLPQGLKIDNNRLSIFKIPNIKVKSSSEIEGKIKTATLSKTPTNKYFISILVEQDKELPKKPKITEKTTIGIDLGIKHFATLSNGRKVENPKYLKKLLKKLAKQQKSLSRKKKGSNNRAKQRLKVALVHEKITNQRSDFIHKLTYQLTHENQVNSIAIEDLAVENMAKNHHLARAITDVAWQEIRRQLEYKCDWYGKNLLIIGRFEPSSKMCPKCGWINQELGLDQREWVCPRCGTKHDRDVSAAQNIKCFALYRRACGNQRLWRVVVRRSLKQESPDFSRGECQFNTQIR